MYQQVMKTNYETLDSLGCVSSKPASIAWTEQGRMLSIGDRGCSQKTRTTQPFCRRALGLGLGHSPCLSDRGTLSAKEEECYLNSLQSSCATLPGEESKILSDQRSALQLLQEIEMMHKSLNITASVMRMIHGIKQGSLRSPGNSTRAEFLFLLCLQEGLPRRERLGKTQKEPLQEPALSTSKVQEQIQEL
uniref:Zinc finger protein 425 n=1 Tax=Molossus molossus TaxID=27622 RepID=A0A7J8HE98_MOLMO|nr:zinc finger protein 425 [Molossus molossus]